MQQIWGGQERLECMHEGKLEWFELRDMKAFDWSLHLASQITREIPVLKHHRTQSYAVDHTGSSVMIGGDLS